MVIHKSKPHIDSGRQSTGTLNRYAKVNQSKEQFSQQGSINKKQQIKRLQHKLKQLQKKIDIMKSNNKYKKQVSSQRSQSKIKDVQIAMIDNKSAVSAFSKKKQGFSSKMLKKSQSDKYLIKPQTSSKSKKHELDLNVTDKQEQKESQIITKLVTQMVRSQLSGDRMGTKVKQMKKEGEKNVCYYIENACECMGKSYLLAYRDHLTQSMQTLKYLQHIRKPSLKELEKHSIHLPNSKHKYSIVLDLDETLIHCNQSLSIPHDVTLKIKFPTGQKIDAGVNIRPFTTQLLKQLSTICEIIVFTASHQCYANVVLDHIDSKGQFISHRLFRTHCWQTQEGVYIKDLRVMKNRSLDNILLVDNAPYSYFYQLANGIPIIPFYDDKEDQQLLHLIRYVKNMIKASQKQSLQQLNHQYFQLSQYFHYQDIEVLTTKLYKHSIHKYKQTMI